eukprot:GGOE01005025.1.p3 GENE.GGOE01005025.1~~GGOE01005025.1.p3  ORF type:complete len:145 (-),score=20.39 GGOE01005025.1:381-815(-)
MKDHMFVRIMECEHPLMHTTVLCTALFALYLLLCCWLQPTNRLVLHEPVTTASATPMEPWPAQLFSKNVFVAFARYRSLQGYGRALKPESGAPKAQPLANAPTGAARKTPTPSPVAKAANTPSVPEDPRPPPATQPTNTTRPHE